MLYEFDLNKKRKQIRSRHVPCLNPSAGFTHSENYIPAPYPARPPCDPGSILGPRTLPHPPLTPKLCEGGNIIPIQEGTPRPERGPGLRGPQGNAGNGSRPCLTPKELMTVVATVDAAQTLPRGWPSMLVADGSQFSGWKSLPEDGPLQSQVGGAYKGLPPHLSSRAAWGTAEAQSWLHCNSAPSSVQACSFPPAQGWFLTGPPAC